MVLILLMVVNCTNFVVRVRVGYAASGKRVHSYSFIRSLVQSVAPFSIRAIFVFALFVFVTRLAFRLSDKSHDILDSV